MTIDKGHRTQDKKMTIGTRRRTKDPTTIEPWHQRRYWVAAGRGASDEMMPKRRKGRARDKDRAKTMCEPAAKTVPATNDARAMPAKKFAKKPATKPAAKQETGRRRSQILLSRRSQKHFLEEQPGTKTVTGMLPDEAQERK